MLRRLLGGALLACLLPLTAQAVYFPKGIDWTHPVPEMFVTSLYLNALGRAPNRSESQQQSQTLRRGDSRKARLRMFESIVSSREYKGEFSSGDNSWQVYRAPDYNYNNGTDSWRYRAGTTTPNGFESLPGGRRFSQPIAASLAEYYNAFCYRGEPCIDNPELARERDSGVYVQQENLAHACADPAQLTAQFKWVAVNSTTYPVGPDDYTVCVSNGYFVANNLNLEYHRCEQGFINCYRDSTKDAQATRGGNDSQGNPSLYFSNGARLTLTKYAGNTAAIQQPTTTQRASNSHECADSSIANSVFTWRGPRGTGTSNGIGASIICMEDYYYDIVGITLNRFDCGRGFTNCQANPRKNLKASRRTRIDGEPGFEFANGTNVTLASRGSASAVPSPTRDTTTASNSQVEGNTRTPPAVPTVQTPKSDLANSDGKAMDYRAGLMESTGALFARTTHTTRLPQTAFDTLLADLTTLAAAPTLAKISPCSPSAQMAWYGH